MKKLRNKQGFTLIELVVVMAIIAVLAILVIGAITIARRSSTEAANRANGRTVQACLEGFFAKNKKYCGTTGFACPSVPAGFSTIVGSTPAATGMLNNTGDGVTCQLSGGTSGTTTKAGGGSLTAISETNNTYTLEVNNYDASAYLTDKLEVK